VQPTQSIHYSNCDEFQEKLAKICPLKDSIEPKSLCQNVIFHFINYNFILIYFAIIKCQNNFSCLKCCNNSNEPENNVEIDCENNQELNELNNISTKKQTKKYFKLIIIDFTCVQFIDEFAFKCLEKIQKEYKNDGVEIVLTNCNGNYYKIN
jgi:hypothetical protein